MTIKEFLSNLTFKHSVYVPACNLVNAIKYDLKHFEFTCISLIANDLKYKIGTYGSFEDEIIYYIDDFDFNDFRTFQEKIFELFAPNKNVLVYDYSGRLPDKCGCLV